MVGNLGCVAGNVALPEESVRKEQTGRGTKQPAPGQLRGSLMQMGPRRGEGGVQRETRIVAEPRARILAQPERRPLPRIQCRCRLTDLIPFDLG